jgi:ABC-type nitrate/sulfonate/bicarbonate transport system ATPase subunit
MNQLEIHNLAKFYGTKKVLKDISFTVRDGEFVSILGPSGSGKSTLFQMIGGITKPSSGTIYLNGKNINGKRGHISYTPQSASLLPWRTVLENVVLGQEIAGKKDLEKARKMIKRAGLEGFEEAYPLRIIRRYETEGFFYPKHDESPVAYFAGRTIFSP